MRKRFGISEIANDEKTKTLTDYKELLLTDPLTKESNRTRDIYISRIRLTELLHTMCYNRNIESITSYQLFEELRNNLHGEPEEWIFENMSQQQMLQIMKIGVRHRLFSKPYWTGTGMTPYSGAARRQRMWDVKGVPRLPNIQIIEYCKIRVVCNIYGEEEVNQVFFSEVLAFFKHHQGNPNNKGREQ